MLKKKTQNHKSTRLHRSIAESYQNSKKLISVFIKLFYNIEIRNIKLILQRKYFAMME